MASEESFQAQTPEDAEKDTLAAQKVILPGVHSYEDYFSLSRHRRVRIQ
jgi:hypothetical protein